MALVTKFSSIIAMAVNQLVLGTEVLPTMTSATEPNRKGSLSSTIWEEM